MKRILVLILLLAIAQLAWAEGARGECYSPPAKVSRQEISCDADAQTCAVWLRFRQERPYPYQAISMLTRQDSGHVTLILSELPPLGGTHEMARLLRAVFGVHSEALHRLRYPIGLDGWLEDWVVSLPYDKGPMTTIADANGGRIQVPLALAEQLNFLNDAIFGTSEVQYVDDLTADRVKIELPNLQITTGELSQLAMAKTEDWKALSAFDAAPQAFSQLGRSVRPALFTDNKKLLVALVIPQNTEMKSLRSIFRKFAIGSDYIIGSVRPKKGGLILLARSRLLSLRTLPPLRFETLEILQGSSQGLGQSYERQRVFAGKIPSGVYAGWDWAPIYLSPQLQDTELGTLLNIADQQLKSWSQCGNVQYASFDYPVPSDFPFKTRRASDWFHDATNTSELTFNWNTSGFSTASDTVAGRIVTASGTAALPVSYILPSHLNPLAAAVSGELEVVNDIGQLVREGSRVGSEYFSRLNDPILARVARNVFLFQILNDAKPFRVDVRKRFSVPKRSRSELISDLLTKRTDSWLTAMQHDAAMSATGGMRAVKLLKTKAGLSQQQISQLLASPEKHEQELLRLARELEMSRVAGVQLANDIIVLTADYMEVAAKSKTEFISQCRQLGGQLEQGKDRLSCQFSRRPGSAPLSLPTPYLDRRTEMEVQLRAQKAEFESAVVNFKKQAAAFEKLAAQGQAAELVADDLRRMASYSSDLDGILNELLTAAEQTASGGSIQTPTLVLSRDTADSRSVGGHNIDALPWLAKVEPGTVAPRTRRSGDRLELVIPKSGTENSALIARAVATVSEVPPLPARELESALHAPVEPRANFLERLVQRGSTSDISPTIKERASHCACDIYIEDGGVDTLFVVRVRPPPPGSLDVLVGRSAAIEHLAGTARDKTVMFANVSVGRATSISESAARIAVPGAKRDFLEQQIDSALAFFRHPLDSVGVSLGWRTKQGRNVMLRATEGESPREFVEMLVSRPAWGESAVKEGKSAIHEAGNVTIVEVKFGSGGMAPRSIEVHTFSADGVKTASTLASAQRALSRAKVSDTVKLGLNQLAEQITQDAKDIRSVEFFFQSTGAETGRWQAPQGDGAQTLALGVP